MSQKETKYICYTGIGSNKTGTHTAKDFLKRMEKNRNNFNEPVPKSVKTLDQWIKCSGANKGRCKTKKKPFKFKLVNEHLIDFGQSDGTAPKNLKFSYFLSY